MKHVSASTLQALIAAITLFLFGMAYTYEGIRELISIRYGFALFSGLLFIYVVISLSAAILSLTKENEQIRDEINQLKKQT
jgi:uncharacterized membrane protein